MERYQGDKKVDKVGSVQREHLENVRLRDGVQTEGRRTDLRDALKTFAVEKPAESKLAKPAPVKNEVLTVKNPQPNQPAVVAGEAVKMGPTVKPAEAGATVTPQAISQTFVSKNPAVTEYTLVTQPLPSTGLRQIVKPLAVDSRPVSTENRQPQGNFQPAPESSGFETDGKIKEALKEFVPFAVQPGLKKTGEEEKRTGKKSESSKESHGKRSAARSGPSAEAGGERKLEAASSGVAGNGGEAARPSELPSGLHSFKPDRTEKTRFSVREAHARLGQYVYKSKPPISAAAVIARATDLSEQVGQLEQELRRSLGAKRIRDATGKGISGK